MNASITLIAVVLMIVFWGFVFSMIARFIQWLNGK